MPLAAPQPSSRSTLLACLLLAAATLLVFAPVLRCGFVNFDDDLYVTNNPQVQAGWTVASLNWAWRSTLAFWHPLTWMSLQLDCQLAGLNPAWFHGVNLLLHLANVLLLFLVLRALTETLWLSALAAALFALHPQHVEAVAWIAERKGLLSTFFGLLSLAAYVGYARRGGAARYLLALVLFACSLLAKPMLVTLPFVWLLLDYWPLRRLNGTLPRWRSLMLEKLPALLLAVGLSVVAVHAEQEIGALSEAPAWSTRLASVLVNYRDYLGQTIWPVGLTVYDPRPEAPPYRGAVGLAVAVLLTLTGLAVWQATRRPYLLVGWLWFLGTLFPVSGVVAVGSHRLADRYTYWPHIGLFVLLVWFAHETASRWRWGQRVGVGLAVLLLAVCGTLSAQQLRCWRDSVALWTQALAVRGEHALMHNNLADAYHQQGCTAEARQHWETAVRLVPRYECACNNLALLYLREGRTAEARPLLLRLNELRPDTDQPPLQLGALCWNEGRAAEALDWFRQAVERNPANPEGHARCGQILLRLGRVEEAEQSLTTAVRLRPDAADLHCDLGRACQWRGNLEKAARHQRKALALQPQRAATHDLLGTTLALQGRLTEAAEHHRSAVAVDARAVHYRCNLALVLHDLSQLSEAEAEFREALRQQPRWPDEALRLARQLATAADPRRRCGPLSLRLARQASLVLGNDRPEVCETLASAQQAASDARLP
ncbi:MAG: tetratricopeptide repeat protein [Planctomycetia bacterium]|nr:tetratricopeptide repeat protein [Planctomycetia bacterium]